MAAKRDKENKEAERQARRKAKPPPIRVVSTVRVNNSGRDTPSSINGCQNGSIKRTPYSSDEDDIYSNVSNNRYSHQTADRPSSVNNGSNGYFSANEENNRPKCKFLVILGSHNFICFSPRI
jgi:hypothetical protein